MSGVNSLLGILLALNHVLSGVSQSINTTYSQPVLPQAKNGEEERGKAVFQTHGQCLLCHQVQQLEAPFQGNLGPDLSAVGERLTAGEIRFRIVDTTRINPNTVMPAYFRTTNLNQVADEFKGLPILSAQEVEDVVVYLGSLRLTDNERAE